MNRFIRFIIFIFVRVFQRTNLIMKKDIFNKKGAFMKATCAEIELLDIN